MSLTVGQKLFYVPRNRFGGEPREVTVVKIGRKWAHLDLPDERIDRETLEVYSGGYMAHAKVWRSREEWEVATRLEGDWGAFMKWLRNKWQVPEGVTSSDIRTAAKALGCDLDAAR